MIADERLPDLPLITVDSPVTGAVQIISDATWEVGKGISEAVFQVSTPTAIYYLHGKSGALLSLQDQNGTDYISYSYGSQPGRGFPLLGSCCQPPGSPTAVEMLTTLDMDHSSPTHARFASSSKDGSWRTTWDFYLTHVTLTVEKSARDYRVSFSGAPGGDLLNASMTLSDGKSDSAKNFAFAAPLSPPAWVRFAPNEPGAMSLFVIEHIKNTSAVDYRAKTRPPSTALSATVEFGQRIATEKSRVSLGLSEASSVALRQQFVLDLVR